MLIREATINDIAEMQIVRNAVKENALSNPALVTDADCEEYLFNRGRGWVCEIKRKIIGFAIVDLVDNNIWALFLLPQFEKKGIGRKLHDIMLDWYFLQTDKTLWLSTAPGTRAENFYRKAGWKATGTYGKTEIKFEMDSIQWFEKRKREA
jgi:GNAT superfamily N-acetyltransferase